MSQTLATPRILPDRRTDAASARAESRAAGEAERLLRLLLAVDLFLVGMYLVDWATGGQIWILGALFNLDAEETIPAWFSSLQLFGAGAALLFAEYRSADRGSSLSLLLVLAGLGFVFLSMDEAAAIHEKLGIVLRGQGVPAFVAGHGRWIPIYALLGLAGLALCRRGLLRLWREYRREALLLAAGMAVFVAGAVIVEVIGHLAVRDRGLPNATRVQVAIEELMEMVGVSIVLYGTLLLGARRRSAAP